MKTPKAFTLIELLTAVAVFAVAMVIVFSIIGQASGLWRRSSSEIEAFQSARLAFDLLTRNLSQATLNTYLDYDNPTNASRYVRKSDLALVSGPAGLSGFPGSTNTGQAIFFQAPLSYATNTGVTGGLDMLLNTCGYYISFNTNNTYPPHAVAANPYRYRLMQLLVPAENNTIYAASNDAWFSTYSNQAQPIADNVIALIVRPQDPEATPSDLPDLNGNYNYSYDSTAGATNNPQPATAQQLPPVLKLIMIAVDEASMNRLIKADGKEPQEIHDALVGKFMDQRTFDSDLANLETSLAKNRINYRVFSSAVPLRESKWTK